jgi:endonuclease III
LLAFEFYNARMDKRNTPIKRAAVKIPANGTKPSKAVAAAMPKKTVGRSLKPRGARQAPPDPARVAEIFRRFAAADPHPKGELAYVNPFTLLVAVVLSAQATDTGVNKATPALFARANTPEKMLGLGEEALRGMIKTIGLYRTKARNVIALSEQLIKEFGGEVPHNREALETLPGVGRKTANVVLNIAFGEPAIAVDTHVFRV